MFANEQCTDGDCEDGVGTWTYTDKTTYEGNWVGTQKQGQAQIVPIYPIKENLKKEMAWTRNFDFSRWSHIRG